MGIGASLFLIAVGAILAWGVHISNSGGFDINTIGTILMVVGLIGLVLSFVFWGGFGSYGIRRSRYVDEDVPVGRRRRVIEDDVV
jgi:hypothetical protein